MIEEKILSITVDPQNTFCPPSGELPVPEGDKIMEPANCINRAVKKRGGAVIFSRDWHTGEVGPHFEKFPPHGIQNTIGAEFHPNLDQTLVDYIVSKGQNPCEDAFSLLDGLTNYDGHVVSPRELIATWIRPTYIFVTGLALDYCVKATVIDLCDLGFRVVVVLDATRAVNIDPGDGIRAIIEMLEAGAKMMTTKKAVEFIEAA